MSRTGIGYDSHRLEPGRRFVLAGVTIDHDAGPAAHSDGDVLTHAVIDALFGAANMGDIGLHYPDTDPAFAGAASLDLLRDAVRRVADAGFAPAYADTTVVCERPKLAPHRDAIWKGLTDALGAPVNVKFTTGEGIGFVGRGEGIAALAAVTLDRGQQPAPLDA